MTQFLLVLAVALTVGVIVFGVVAALTGEDPGLRPVEPDGRAIPLPERRPLVESDLTRVRFDTGWRGYRMAQVDVALQRVAYDLGYKDELIRVLEEEVRALREGRFPDAEVLRRAREAAIAGVEAQPAPGSGSEPLPGSEPPPELEPLPGSEPLPELERAPEPNAATGPDPEGEPDPVAAPSPVAEPHPEGEPEPEAAADPDPGAEPDPESQPEPEPGSAPESEAEDVDIHGDQQPTASGGSR